MSKLHALRVKVDKVDSAMLKLLAERLSLAEEIAKVKRAEGIPVVDEGREEALLKRLKEKGAKLGLKPAEVELIFQILILLSVRRQVSGR